MSCSDLNTHVDCCAHCEECNPQEDRSAAALRRKYGKPLFELNQDIEVAE